ncbi:MAG: glycosyltransferase family 2 protein, partial [Chloroflexi bacterium]|nr:glycosyltransferase family 2 protein [Chloroflexota bacterium]
MVTPGISVIIPTRNRADILDRCLRALERQTAPAGSFEVIVSDDGSTDDTRRVPEAGKYNLSLKTLLLPH